MSTEPSTSSAVVKFRNCVICSKLAHGNHFGVDCCRACAAFFRRTIVNQTKTIPCVKKNSKCEADEFGRWQCKKCRTNRCLELGMTPTNIRYNYDVPIDRCLSSDPVQTFLIQSGTHYFYMKHFDLSLLLREADYVIKKTPKIKNSTIEMTQLEKLAIGLHEVRNLPSVETFAETKVIGQKEMWNKWITDIRRAGIWIMHFEEFRNLDLEIKLEIVKCMWHMFTKLERAAMTAKMRRSKKCKENEFVFGAGTKLNCEEVKYDHTWFSNGTKEQMKDILNPTSFWFCEPIINKIMELEPTDVELSFMLSNLCFELTGKKHGGKIQEITDKLQDILANDLHKYYLKTDKLSRYSYRLTKMLSLNRLCQANQFTDAACREKAENLFG